MKGRRCANVASVPALRLLTLALLLGSAGAAQERKLDSALLEQAAKEEVLKEKIPGAAIAVVSDDRIVYAKGLGVANIETGAPVSTDMLFRLGSTTKMLTAAAVLSLALEGKLDLDTPVGAYIKDLHPSIARLTAHQVLTHTSGLKDDAVMDGLHDDSALGAGIRLWNADWFFTEPGAIYSYSNPGYWLAGRLAEVVAGKPYADVMAERVFRPLGMSRTTLRPLMALTFSLAQGHNPASGAPVVIRPAPDNTANWPAGSVFSSVEELSRFVIALMNDGRVEGKQVLPSKLISLMLSPQVKTPDPQRSYGYGLAFGETRGVRFVSHGGARAGYGSLVQIAPDHRLAAVILTNRSGGSLPGTAEKLFEMLVPMRPALKRAEALAIPMPAAELDRYAAVYVNGDQKSEIVSRNGKLLWRAGGREEEIIKTGDWQFAVLDAQGKRTRAFRLVPGPDGGAAYLYAGSRSAARLR